MLPKFFVLATAFAAVGTAHTIKRRRDEGASVEKRSSEVDDPAAQYDDGMWDESKWGADVYEKGSDDDDDEECEEEEELSRRDESSAEVSGGEASGGEASGEEASGGEASGGEASGGEESGGEESVAQVSGEEASSGESSGGEASGEEGSSGESSGGESSDVEWTLVDPNAVVTDEKFTGTATFYNLLDPNENDQYASGSVHCSSEKFKNEDRIVALALDTFNPAFCGKTIVMTDTSNGNTATAVVYDSCKPCSSGDVDMTPVVWNGLHGEGKEIEGIFTVDWHFEAGQPGGAGPLQPGATE